MDDINKSKKTIVTSAVSVAVIGCLIVLAGAFTSDSISLLRPVGASSTQSDVINDRSGFTLEAARMIDPPAAEKNNIDQDEHNDRTPAKAFGKTFRKDHPSAPEAGKTQEKGVTVEFDRNIEQDGNTFIIEPSGTMKPSPALLEDAKKNNEASKKIRTGLFRTQLDIRQEGDNVLLTAYLCNISQEDLKLDFDLGREFDIIIDHKGDEIFSRFYGTEECLPAISHHKLKKGEKLSFSYTWDCIDNDGNKVEPGKYAVTVKMLPMINYKRNFSPDELSATKDLKVNDN